MSANFFLHRPDLDNFVLVYTMGKVGSTAVARSLESFNIYCRHFHWASTETQAFFDRLESVTPTDLPMWRFYVLQNRLNMRRARSALGDGEYAWLIKVITAVRAPIEQIVSHYFQFFPLYEAMLRNKKLDISAANVRDNISEGVKFYLAKPDRTITALTSALTEQNWDRVLFCWFVHNYLHWFDTEFRPWFPADILGGTPCDGFQIADTSLVLRFEDLSTHGERAVAAYAQRPRFKLVRENDGAQKIYGDLYREVAATMKFPAKFVDRLCGSPYVRHFYSDEERHGMRKKWMD